MSDEEAAITETNQQEDIVSSDPLTQALADIANLQARVAELEKYAHATHTIGVDAVDEIAVAAVQKINDRLRQAAPAVSQ